MGAWAHVYEKGLSAPAGSSLGYGIVAVKKELAYNGYDHGMILTTPAIGDAASKSIVAFQAAHGLVPDGKAGPYTAEALFRPRARLVESAKGIPGESLCHLKTQESANDPAAFGFVDPDDHGLVQINLRLHSGVTLAEAIDPAFCLSWAGEYLASNHEILHDWPATIASYNVGLGGAERWLRAGKPASGGPADDPTLYQRATLYVYRVSRSSC